MAIWQAMKGDSQNPKRFWNRRDLKHQHFTRTTGRREWAACVGTFGSRSS